MTGLFAHIVFALATAMTPHCHAGQVANCHYRNAVEVETPTAQIFASRHHGVYTVQVFPRHRYTCFAIVQHADGTQTPACAP